VTNGDCTSAAISPDGRRLAYATNKDGPYALWLKDLTDGGEERLTDPEIGCPGDVSWSFDGTAVAFSVTPHGSTRRDIWVADVAAKKAAPFIASAAADEHWPRFSPNGNKIAFVSNESGGSEVYVKSYPEAKAVRQVSIGGGGDRPEWTPDGRKLYYRGKGGIYLAPIAPNWTDGSRPALVCRRPFGQSHANLADYAVAPDGRLLVVEPSDRGPTVSRFTVVLNWHRVFDQAPVVAAAPRR